MHINRIKSLFQISTHITENVTEYSLLYKHIGLYGITKKERIVDFPRFRITLTYL